MGIMDWVSPALTVGTQAVAADQEGKQQGNALLRAIQLQQGKSALEQAQTDHFNAETKKLAGPEPKDYEIIKTPNGYARVPKAGDPGLIKDPASNSPYEVEHPEQAPLPSTGGYVNRDGTPILGKDGQRIMPPSMKPPAEQKDHYTFITTTGKDGVQHVSRANTATGDIEETSSQAKPGGAGGGQSLAPEDRVRMMSQAKIDNAEMKRIEGRVLRGELKFGTAAGLSAAAQGAHGSPLNEAASVLGNAAAGALDPDIQKYITANASYGRIMGNLQSKRYTDNQAQIEKTISGLKGNDLHQTISYKQQLRDASLADPANASSQQTHAPAQTTHAASPLRQKYDAAVAHLRAKGTPDAQIHATLGEPPGDE